MTYVDRNNTFYESYNAVQNYKFHVIVQMSNQSVRKVQLLRSTGIVWPWISLIPSPRVEDLTGK